MVKRLAAFVSGRGTTLRNLAEQIDAGKLVAHLALVVGNDPDAPALEFARQQGIAAKSISARGPVHEYSQHYFALCRTHQIDLVLLAGFLKLIHIPTDFLDRVLNIHPSLIPAFCGRGLYGHRVHEAALARGVKISGCTVHFADNEYDHGPIILQRAVPVLDDDTPESLAARVFAAECEAYPEAVRLFVNGCLRREGHRVRVLEPT